MQGEVSSENVIVIAVAAVAMHGILTSPDKTHELVRVAEAQGYQTAQGVAIAAFEIATAMVEEAKHRGLT